MTRMLTLAFLLVVLVLSGSACFPEVSLEPEGWAVADSSRVIRERRPLTAAASQPENGGR